MNNKEEVRTAIGQLEHKNYFGGFDKYTLRDLLNKVLDVNLIENDEITRNYTLTHLDSGKELIYDHSIDGVITVPTDLPKGFVCNIIQKGDGVAHFTNVKHRLGHNSTAGKFAPVGISVIGENENILSGDTQMADLPD